MRYIVTSSLTLAFLAGVGLSACSKGLPTPAVSASRSTRQTTPLSLIAQGDSDHCYREFSPLVVRVQHTDWSSEPPDIVEIYVGDSLGAGPPDANGQDKLTLFTWLRWRVSTSSSDPSVLLAPGGGYSSQFFRLSRKDGTLEFESDLFADEAHLWIRIPELSEEMLYVGIPTPRTNHACTDSDGEDVEVWTVTVRLDP